MTHLSNDDARCAGTRCPSKMNCRRYTERATGSEHAWYAAFWARREAGSSACDMYLPIVPASTFEAADHHALNERTQRLLADARPYNIVCEKGGS